MRMIGLIGGMSWESSTEYYRLINQGIRDRRGPTSSARCLLWSFDFSDIEALQHRGDWESLTTKMVDAARRGADLPGAASGLTRCASWQRRTPSFKEAERPASRSQISEDIRYRGSLGIG